MTQEFSEQPAEHGRSTLTITIVTLLFIAIGLVTIFGLGLTGNTLIIIIILELAFYFSITLMLLQPNIIKGIVKTITNTEQKTVVQQVPVIREVKVPVVKEVEKPVYVEKKVMVDRPVYVQVPRKKLDIPKYEFLGSSETKTYHLRSCRLGKLIKKKYKISNNSDSYFKKHKFHPCMVCIQKLKKV